jgi:hypothetical protein
MHTVDYHLRVTDQKPCSLSLKRTVALLFPLSLVSRASVCSSERVLGRRSSCTLERDVVSVSGADCTLLLWYSVLAINIPKLAVRMCKVYVLYPCLCLTFNRLWAHSNFHKSCSQSSVSETCSWRIGARLFLAVLQQ